MNFPQNRKPQNRIKWAVLGAILSLGSPLGLYLLQTSLSQPDNFILTAYIYNTLGTLVVFTFFGYGAGKFIDRLEFIASHDILTHIYSRGYMQSRLKEQFNLCVRHRLEFVILMLDLDHFKRVNDNYGHDIGDKVLKSVAHILKTTSRQTDIVSRWGGEEFIILCPQINFNEGKHLAERIRANIENLKKPDLGFPPPQTISIGHLSTIPTEHSSLNQILQQLDDLLYQAKNKGRNKVVSKRIHNQQLKTSV